MEQKKSNNIGPRLASMILDHFIMTFGIVIIAIIVVGIGFLIFGNLIDSTQPEWLPFVPLLLGLILFPIYFNKDAIKGKSPGKRILKLVIVNNKNGEIANPIKSVIRNVTLFFWPIEVLFTLFSPERRIGDYIAGTKVILDDKTLKTKLKIGQIILAQLIGTLFIIIFVLFQFTLVMGIESLEETLNLFGHK